MLNSPYKIHKDFLRYYIVPSCEFLEDIPFPNKYLVFWFEKNANVVLSAMNAAWNDGYRFKNLFEGK